MKQHEFGDAQQKFAQHLRRLLELPNREKGRKLDIDAALQEIKAAVDGSEDLTGLIVTQIPARDRRLRECMAAKKHPLADVPSRVLFGEPYRTDDERVARYELIAALMTDSGFPCKLLDDSGRFGKWRFATKSAYFQSRGTAQMNEQLIACWARRLVAPYGEIPDVRVPNNELRDNLARGNRGMTTEDLLEQELA